MNEDRQVAGQWVKALQSTQNVTDSNLTACLTGLWD